MAAGQLQHLGCSRLHVDLRRRRSVAPCPVEPPGSDVGQLDAVAAGWASHPETNPTEHVGGALDRPLTLRASDVGLDRDIRAPPVVGVSDLDQERHAPTSVVEPLGIEGFESGDAHRLTEQPALGQRIWLSFEHDRRLATAGSAQALQVHGGFPDGEGLPR